ncbi:hypothetical protein HELRODRAFT_110688 [Helobdella robusta]|uniref:Laminin G domain-containing protein n=1 Tax=Helobdella robusta TaxID=6412 RepID=T1EF43_HELRO|nr:hypothetical protein HELRODRAFT_110688 [Helobdella robusta]ESO07198.1 hypothetical protein HELRODRAFT_110688 [Helobdella robusta]
MLFKTRKSNGVLFMAKSFTGYERYLLRVRAGMLSFTYDLGSDDRDLTLSNIKVDDGVWHFVRIDRYGNVVELRLDSGDGMRYNSSTPASEHRYLKMSTANVLGDLSYNQYSKQTAVLDNLEKTCISDVRYSGHLLPLSNEENTESLVTMTMVGGSDVGCSITGVCVDGLNCPTDQICVDLWMKSECRCKQFWVANDPSHQNSICVAKSCSDSPCMNGGTCVMLDGKVACICSAEWGGLYCTDNGPKEEETKNNTERNFNLVAAIVVPIIVGLLLLLLLLFLIYWCCCRRKEDRLLYGEPDKEIRENVIAYDDEGAGEQDNYAFDLGKLQKSSTPLEVDTLKKTPNLETLPAYTTRGGDYPSIADFISDRLNTVDGDPDNTGDDSKVNFEFEGQGSDAGSLSSLASSEADRDIDFDWLERAGPHFARLADLYGDGGQV